MPDNNQKPEMGAALAAGFAPLKKNWLALLITLGVPYVLISIIVIGGPLYLIFKELGSWFVAGEAPQHLSFEMYAPVIGYYLAMSFGATLLASMLYAAIYRWLGVREGERQSMGLRLGADEWRLFIIQLLILLVMLVPSGGVIGLGTALIKAGNEGLGASLLLVGLLFIPVYLVLAMVRLSLAPVQTFATGSLKLFGSWRMTKGAFWVMFLSFAVTAVIMALVSTVLTTPANILFYSNPNTGWLSDPEILETLERAEWPQLMRDTFLSTSALIALVWMALASVIVGIIQVVVYGGMSFYFYNKLKPGAK